MGPGCTMGPPQGAQVAPWGEGQGSRGPKGLHGVTEKRRKNLWRVLQWLGVWPQTRTHAPQRLQQSPSSLPLYYTCPIFDVMLLQHLRQVSPLPLIILRKLFERCFEQRVFA